MQMSAKNVKRLLHLPRSCLKVRENRNTQVTISMYFTSLVSVDHFHIAAATHFAVIEKLFSLGQTICDIRR